MYSEDCHVLRGLSCTQKIVMYSENCHVLRGLSFTQRIVMYSEDCHVLRGLSCTQEIVMYSKDCHVLITSRHLNCDINNLQQTAKGIEQGVDILCTYIVRSRECMYHGV